MDITLGELHKLPIKKLKVILDKLKKEPKSVQNETAIMVIRNIIKDKKGKTTHTHPNFVKTDNGLIREKKCKPIHLQ